MIENEFTLNFMSYQKQSVLDNIQMSDSYNTTIFDLVNSYTRFVNDKQRNLIIIIVSIP